MPVGDQPTTVVLGAGIQGVTVALALARERRKVELIDKDPAPMLRASLVNEGKVHLGHVYALDASFATCELMMHGALRFAPLVEEWVGPVNWAALRSNPFLYVRLEESLCDPADLAAHYERIDAAYRERRTELGSDYVGTTPDRMWQQVESPRALAGGVGGWAVETPEVAIDPARLRRLLSDAVDAQPRITTRYGTTIESVERTAHGFRVVGLRGGEAWRISADVVVNCLWTDRLRIDGQLGLRPEVPWVYRRKFRVLARLPNELADLPSMTFVQGPFGDVVTSPHDGTMYLSWYPTCLRGWTGDESPPPLWDEVEPEEEAAVLRETLSAMEGLIPGIGGALPESVSAGVIFAWGATDIDDPGSELHRRARIGPEFSDGYVTVNTGKLTTAPLFADRVARVLSGREEE